eukprot:TRINITY_DN23289_c0_g1_i1.p1 TRINITY_DN23289_c0_g1~~TRINITY_DN23289_c0_g1_i1.p1  ORF type:complete len:456 (-),score=99.77 TRINITY_DN23289_c0_g1_i1:174-1508(-)
MKVKQALAIEELLFSARTGSKGSCEGAAPGGTCLDLSAALAAGRGASNAEGLEEPPSPTMTPLRRALLARQQVGQAVPRPPAIAMDQRRRPPGSTLVMAGRTGLSARGPQNEGRSMIGSRAPAAAFSLARQGTAPGITGSKSQLPRVEDTAARVPDLESLEAELKSLRADSSRLAGPSSSHEVLPRLWIGGGQARLPQDTTHLVSIVELGTDPDKPLPYPQFSGMNRLMITVGDLYDDDIARYFQITADFLHEMQTSSKKTVYVHCKNGQSQSAAIVVAYLLMRRGCSLLTAFAHLALSRDVAPNIGFVGALNQLEVELTGKCSLPMMDYWRITVLHIEYARNMEVNELTNEDIAAEWTRLQAGGSNETTLGRLVAGFQTVCRRITSGNPQIRAFVRQMDEGALTRRISEVREAKEHEKLLRELEAKAQEEKNSSWRNRTVLKD